MLLRGQQASRCTHQSTRRHLLPVCRAGRTEPRSALWAGSCMRGPRLRAVHRVFHGGGDLCVCAGSGGGTRLKGANAHARAAASASPIRLPHEPLTPLNPACLQHCTFHHAWTGPVALCIRTLALELNMILSAPGLHFEDISSARGRTFGCRNPRTSYSQE